MKTKNLIIIALALAFGTASAKAQIVSTQVVENGGSGPYKAEIVADASLPSMTIYRPQDLKAVVQKEGRLPVILYANGGCSNSNVEIRYFLNELVSHGYVAVAIGPYDEEDFIQHWKGVMSFMYPANKTVVLANGEEIPRPQKGGGMNFAEMFKNLPPSSQGGAAKEAEKTKEPSLQGASFKTYPGQLLEGLDWLEKNCADPSSEFYQLLDLEKVAVMGQSCGGTQALGVSYDPRISTTVVLNSGLGEMAMQGVGSEDLAKLHSPVLYLVGGEDDIAYGNALKDYGVIKNIPVALVSSLDGHEGTYYEKNGGAYAIVVGEWLDWQLKGRDSLSALFLDDRASGARFSLWSFTRKNF